MSWLGIDIGGANLKAADGEGWASSVAFPVWRDPGSLADRLQELIQAAPRAGRFAVTMTAELCDCFETKSAGVQHILDAVEAVDKRGDAGIYFVTGELGTSTEARRRPHLAAASNWHALASFAARFVLSRAGLLIDVGSTTTDVVPIVEGRVATLSRTDTERLLSQELLYRGVGRTPICAVVDTLPLQSGECSVAAELFATTADAFVVSGELVEESKATWTADGRPLTRQFARQRLSRQVCADVDELAEGIIEAMAKRVSQALLEQVSVCVETVAKRLRGDRLTCVVSGAGEFVARGAVARVLAEHTIVTLEERIGMEASRCAPAHALAVLANEGKLSLPAG